MFIHYSFDVPSKNVYFNQQLALKSSMITFIVLTPSPPDANIALVVLKDDHEWCANPDLCITAYANSHLPSRKT